MVIYSLTGILGIFGLWAGGEGRIFGISGQNFFFIKFGWEEHQNPNEQQDQPK